MKVIDIAKGYIGTTEIHGNHGWHNKDFQRKMEVAGWDDGEAWCSLFVEMVFKEAYPEFFKEFDIYCSDGAVMTLNNFTRAGYKISTIPVLGSIMIMQHYTNNKADWHGHAGIVTSVATPSQWNSIEGNTNSKGSREGDSVQEKPRSLFYEKTGLRVAGFIMVVETLKLEGYV